LPISPKKAKIADVAGLTRFLPFLPRCAGADPRISNGRPPPASKSHFAL